MASKKIILSVVAIISSSSAFIAKADIPFEDEGWWDRHTPGTPYRKTKREKKFTVYSSDNHPGADDRVEVVLKKKLRFQAGQETVIIQRNHEVGNFTGRSIDGVDAFCIFTKRNGKQSAKKVISKRVMKVDRISALGRFFVFSLHNKDLKDLRCSTSTYSYMNEIMRSFAEIRRR